MFTADERIDRESGERKDRRKDGRIRRTDEPKNRWTDGLTDGRRTDERTDGRTGRRTVGLDGWDGCTYRQGTDVRKDGQT